MQKLIVAVAVACAAAIAATPASAARPKACAGGFNPDGSAGSFYLQIKARGLSCPAAKAIVKAWVKFENASDGANPTARVTIKKYKCSGRAVKTKGDTDGGLAVKCAKGAKAVTFYGHP